MTPPDRVAAGVPARRGTALPRQAQRPAATGAARFIPFAAALVSAALAAAEPAHVATRDGLALSFAPDGRLTNLRIDGADVSLTTEARLLRVRDAGAKSRFVAVTATATQRENAIALQSRDSPLGLDVTATITAHGDLLDISGEVSMEGAADRCVDLAICLPVAPRGWKLGAGLYDGPAPASRKKAAKRADPDADIDTAEPDDNAMYPLCAVSNAAERRGLCLAVPPTHPTRFAVRLDAAGAQIIFRIGISAASAKPRTTAFHAIAYRHDPAWGFRSALARYYDFYRDEFFTRRVKRIGAWTTQNPSKLAHPELYAYHEAGFAGWRHPAGTDSGVNLKPSLELFDEGPAARTLGDFERLCELELDAQRGIYALPYTIVGQRQLLRLPRLPKNLDEALHVLDAWAPTEPIRFDGPPQAGSFRSAEEQKAIIRNSTLHDTTHQLAVMPRAYRGPTLTFPQNPNPRLFRGENRPTIASYTLDYYIPLMLQSPFVTGIYVDSLGRWCGLYNYRAEHFKYSTVPLTYHGEPAQVCLWNLQSHAEYLWEAARRLHAGGKILMANGVGADRVMLGFACDVMGREGAPSYESGEGFYAGRVAAGPKPYCLLNATHRNSERLWNSCLYQGYLTGCNSPAGLDAEAKYLPLIIKCNEAGWQPVTHARATPAAVGIERWGGERPNAPLLFTVMNRSTEPVKAEIAIDIGATQRGDNAHGRTLVTSRAIEARRDGGKLVLAFPLGPEETEVIEITR